MQDGTPVSTAQQWRDKRRPELMDLFAKQVYGRSPEACPIQSKVISTTDAIQGEAASRGGCHLRWEIGLRHDETADLPPKDAKASCFPYP